MSSKIASQIINICSIGVSDGEEADAADDDDDDEDIY